jgi:hypothetical protein
VTPFRLDGLALGAFPAVMARQSGGVERLTRAVPRAVAVAGGLLVVTFVWTLLVSRKGLDLVLPVRAVLILMLLACLLLRALITPKHSLTSRFFRSASWYSWAPTATAFTSTITSFSYYLTANRTQLDWRTGSALTGQRSLAGHAGWVGLADCGLSEL